MYGNAATLAEWISALIMNVQNGRIINKQNKLQNKKVIYSAVCNEAINSSNPKKKLWIDVKYMRNG